MGFNMTAALGGLLEEGGKQFLDAGRREQMLADKRLDEERENRKLEAQFVRQQALSDYNYTRNRQGQLEDVNRNREWAVSDNERNFGQQRQLAQEARADNFANTKQIHELDQQKPTELQRTAEYLQSKGWDAGKVDSFLESQVGRKKSPLQDRIDAAKDANFSQEDIDKIIMGKEGRSGAITEAQLAKVQNDHERLVAKALEQEEKLTSMEGVNSNNVNIINALRKNANLPLYKAVEISPEKKGFLGIGNADKKVEWQEDSTTVMPDDEWMRKRLMLGKPAEPGKGGGMVNPGASNGANGVDYDLLYQALGKAESGNRDFNPDGSLVTSSKGAKSGMQVMDDTAANPGMGIKPAQLTGDQKQDAQEYNRVGRELIKALTEKYGGNVAKAVAAYNMGPAAFDAWERDGGDVAKLPEETQKHIVKVMDQYTGKKPEGEPPGAIAGERSPEKQNSPEIDKPASKGLLATEQPGKKPSIWNDPNSPWAGSTDFGSVVGKPIAKAAGGIASQLTPSMVAVIKQFDPEVQKGVLQKLASLNQEAGQKILDGGAQGLKMLIDEWTKSPADRTEEYAQRTKSSNLNQFYR